MAEDVSEAEIPQEAYERVPDLFYRIGWALFLERAEKDLLELSESCYAPPLASLKDSPKYSATHSLLVELIENLLSVDAAMKDLSQHSSQIATMVEKETDMTVEKFSTELRDSLEHHRKKYQQAADASLQTLSKLSELPASCLPNMERTSSCVLQVYQSLSGLIAKNVRLAYRPVVFQVVQSGQLEILKVFHECIAENRNVDYEAKCVKLVIDQREQIVDMLTPKDEAVKKENDDDAAADGEAENAKDDEAEQGDNQHAEREVDHAKEREQQAGGGMLDEGDGAAEGNRTDKVSGPPVLIVETSSTPELEKREEPKPDTPKTPSSRIPASRKTSLTIDTQSQPTSPVGSPIGKRRFVSTSALQENQSGETSPLRRAASNFGTPRRNTNTYTHLVSPTLSKQAVQGQLIAALSSDKKKLEQILEEKMALIEQLEAEKAKLGGNYRAEQHARRKADATRMAMQKEIDAAREMKKEYEELTSGSKDAQKEAEKILEEAKKKSDRMRRMGSKEVTKLKEELRIQGGELHEVRAQLASLEKEKGQIGLRERERAKMAQELEKVKFELERKTKIITKSVQENKARTEKLQKMAKQYRKVLNSAEIEFQSRLRESEIVKMKADQLVEPLAKAKNNRTRAQGLNEMSSIIQELNEEVEDQYNSLSKFLHRLGKNRPQDDEDDSDEMDVDEIPARENRRSPAMRKGSGMKQPSRSSSASEGVASAQSDKWNPRRWMAEDFRNGNPKPPPRKTSTKQTARSESINQGRNNQVKHAVSRSPERDLFKNNWLKDDDDSEDDEELGWGGLARPINAFNRHRS